jgi:hypothetical protein
MTSIYTTTAMTSTPVFQQQPEEAVKQFLIDTLDRKELPKGSLQEILKDGILLCEYGFNCFFFTLFHTRSYS